MCWYDQLMKKNHKEKEMKKTKRVKTLTGRKESMIRK